MKIQITITKQTAEYAVSDVQEHGRIPAWYANAIGSTCHACGWDYKETDEVEAIKPKDSHVITMHSQCFQESVNKATGNKNEN